ncbi:MAG: MFS transporter [Gemmobacter sp.]
MNIAVVVALGVTQIIGYGTLYYAFPIAVPAMAATLGMPETWAYGAFAAGMLAGAGVAPVLGRMMDRIGAPRVMAWGSLLIAGLLALMPGVTAFWQLGVLVVLVEMVAVAVLYDGAFATLALLRGAQARRAITHLTLIAGFASTIFWPLSGWMVGAFGWQATYGAFGALHLGVALPLHLWLVARARGAVAASRVSTAPPAVAPALRGAAARRGFWLLASGFALSGMLIAALGVHLVPLVQAAGMGAAAYLVAMLMGPSQVTIRLIDAILWQRVRPVTVAVISAAALPVAVAALMLAGTTMAGAAAFAVMFGAGQGLASIVRGTVPLSLFGSAGFGAMLGRLTAWRTVLSALAPFGFAVILQGAGPGAAMGVALMLGVASLVPLLALRALVMRADVDQGAREGVGAS